MAMQRFFVPRAATTARAVHAARASAVSGLFARVAPRSYGAALSTAAPQLPLDHAKLAVALDDLLARLASDDTAKLSYKDINVFRKAFVDPSAAAVPKIRRKASVDGVAVNLDNVSGSESSVSSSDAEPEQTNDSFSAFRARTKTPKAAAAPEAEDDAELDVASESDGDVSEDETNEQATMGSLYSEFYKLEYSVPPQAQYTSLAKHKTKFIQPLLAAFEARDLDQVMTVYYTNRAARLSRDVLDLDADDEVLLAATVEKDPVSPDGSYDEELEVMKWEYAPRGAHYLEYNIVLDACARAGRLDIAQGVLEDLRSENGVMTPEVYTLMIKAAVLSGKPEAALAYYEEQLNLPNCPVSPDGYAGAMSALMTLHRVMDGVILFNK